MVMSLDSKSIVYCFIFIYSTLTTTLCLSVRGSEIPEVCLGDEAIINNRTCNALTGSCENRKSRGDRDLTLTDYRELGCYCDDWCLVYGDCCKDKVSEKDYTELEKETFQCTTQHSISSLELPVYIINKCPKTWKHLTLKKRCESEEENPYLKWLVSDNQGFLYKNLYCAICHSVNRQNIHFWLARITCSEKYYELLLNTSSAGRNSSNGTESDQTNAPAKEQQIDSLQNQLLSGECEIKYTAPKIKRSAVPAAKEVMGEGGGGGDGGGITDAADTSPHLSTPEVRPRVFRTCKASLSHCSSSWPEVHSTQNQCIQELCESTESVHYAYLIYPNGAIYKNEYCAHCNGASQKFLTCVQPQVFEFSKVFQHFYPLAIVMDLNNGGRSAIRTKVGFELSPEKKKSAIQMLRCPDDHVYDPFIKECIALTCSEGYVYVGNKCKKNIAGRISPISYSESECLRIAVSEYSLHENGSVYVNSSRRLYNNDEYEINDEGQVLVCTDFNQNYTDSQVNGTGQELVLKFSPALTIVSVIGQVISILCLIVLLTVYALLSKLRNVPGKNLMCLSASLLVAQLLFLTGVGATGTHELCVTISIVLHYSFLAAFFWINVMSFDIWRTFSQDTVTLSTNKKKFRFYSLYAWLSPMVIVAISATLNWSPGVDQSYRPAYAEGLCWISQRMALLICFGLPIALLLTSNIIFYTLTIRHLIHLTKTTKIIEKNEENKHRLGLYVKLSIIMGLTWIFGFIAALAEVDFLWYVFVILNSLQGAFICVSFVITRKVWRLLMEKLGMTKRKTETKDTTRSRSTSLSTVLSTSTKAQLPQTYEQKI